MADGKDVRNGTNERIAGIMKSVAHHGSNKGTPHSSHHAMETSVSTQRRHAFTCEELLADMTPVDISPQEDWGLEGNEWQFNRDKGD